MNIPESIHNWVNAIANYTHPDNIRYCDGSEAEKDELTALAVREGVLQPLNQEKLPGCYYHRSHASDVARTEHLTFICSPTKADAGPTNNWMDPAEARAKLQGLFANCMKGRTMYVVPFLMGPAGSRFSKVGVEITDSVYVVLNMRIMTRMGQVAVDHLSAFGGDYTKCLHSLGDLSPDRRYICHFPQDNEVISIGSGYGGNALLGKKCLALRLACELGRREGWLAEHMLILGVEDPNGKKHYITGAFPSACGKTNLAMIVPPKAMAERGWKVTTIGDDIAWLRPGADGRLWAVNPEAGFFGVAPGTSMKTNPNAMLTIQKNTIYTNVALRADNTVWWEGHDEPAGDNVIDWRGQPWDPKSGEKAAHPNSRFTAPANQCPSLADEWENPDGVPISAMLFGARRQTVVPLVYEARSWQHGTFLGATLASETTAAAVGKVGVLRRDPMAMLPFAGYNMGDYWGHWLDVGHKLSNPPKIFRVNWFRADENGKFMWPGFGDNLRVIEWVIGRCEGKAQGTETPIGVVPTPDALDLSGLDLPQGRIETLLHVDGREWADALLSQRDFFNGFGDHIPAGIWSEHAELERRISAS